MSKYSEVKRTQLKELNDTMEKKDDMRQMVAILPFTSRDAELSVSSEQHE